MTAAAVAAAKATTVMAANSQHDYNFMVNNL